MNLLAAPRNARRQATTLRVTGLGVAVPGIDRPDQALAVKRPVPVPPDWFDVPTALPGRGYRRLPPGCLYLLASARAALIDTGGRLDGIPPERRGAVIGTNNVGAALLEEIDRTIIDRGAAELSPASTPFMAMSSFAGRLALEHRLNAFSLTAGSPAVAGLEALQIAARALAAGRASAVLVGAVEDLPGGDGHEYEGFDVGAVTLVCEPMDEAQDDGAEAYGFCSVRSVFLDPDGDDVAAALEPLRPLPRQGSAHLAGVDTVLDDSPVGRAVAAWLADRVPPERITAVEAKTDGGSLTALLRVVGRLAENPPIPERYAVLTASAQGNVALADITVQPRTRPQLPSQTTENARSRASHP